MMSTFGEYIIVFRYVKTPEILKVKKKKLNTVIIF